MKKLYNMFLMAAVVCGCTSLENSDPYSSTLNTLSVSVVYPDEFSSMLRAQVPVYIEDTGKGSSYTAYTDAEGKVNVTLANGIYRITVSDRSDEYVFNGAADRIRLVDSDQNVTINLLESVSGDIVFKEIYNGGCLAYPLEGTYQSDKYVILHNNTSEVQYLDGLCFGTADPYNSQGTNVWVKYDPVTGEAS